MLARVLSAAVNGIEAFPVEVEVNSGWGDTVIVIIGNKTLKDFSRRIWLVFKGFAGRQPRVEPAPIRPDCRLERVSGCR
jgi:hypothetical protein